jgi:hypothetical protein
VAPKWRVPAALLRFFVIGEGALLEIALESILRAYPKSRYGNPSAFAPTSTLILIRGSLVSRRTICLGKVRLNLWDCTGVVGHLHRDELRAC